MADLIFPDAIVIGAGDELFDFMEPFKPGGVYDPYDVLFMGRVLAVISPAFSHRQKYENALEFAMAVFADNTVHYSDDTYNPNKLINNAYKLANQLYGWLENHGAYVHEVFPYDFFDIAPNLTLLYRLNHFKLSSIRP